MNLLADSSSKKVNNEYLTMVLSEEEFNSFASLYNQGELKSIPN